MAKLGQKLDLRRTRGRNSTVHGHGQHGAHHSSREWRALRARIRWLEVLTVLHPELGEAVAVPTTALMADRWTAMSTLADRWERRALALGLKPMAHDSQNRQGVQGRAK